MEPEDSYEEELEPKVKYSFIVYEEDYEEEENDKDEVQPWDPSDIFFRIT
jgi:hypothetical protein